jgi:hypothetical protein
LSGVAPWISSADLSVGFSEPAIGDFPKPDLAISSADLTTDQFCRPLTTKRRIQ